MDSYEVNPIIAKYVEHRGFTKEDYEALNIPFYYNFTDLENGETVVNREFDSCLQFFTNQIAQNVDYINAFEFFYCQIRENKCTNMG